jgi:hypothetical protein
MGLDYRFRMDMPAKNVGKVLSTMAEMRTAQVANTDAVSHQSEVILPGGEHMILPYSSKFKDGLVDVSDGSSLSLDAGLLVRLDERVAEYLVGELVYVHPGGRVYIGYIYLDVDFEPDGRAKLAFTAATTKMSLLFQESRSVQAAFIELARLGEATSCRLDIEDFTGGVDMFE